jgi:hypothetical protein
MPIAKDSAPRKRLKRSERRAKVAELWSRNYSAPQIAAVLHVAVATVRRDRLAIELELRSAGRSTMQQRQDAARAKVRLTVHEARRARVVERTNLGKTRGVLEAPTEDHDPDESSEDGAL